MERVKTGKCRNWKGSELESVRIAQKLECVRNRSKWKVSEMTQLESANFGARLKLSKLENVAIGKGQNGTLPLHLKSVIYRRGNIGAAVKHSFFSAWAGLSKNRLEHIFQNNSIKSAV